MPNIDVKISKPKSQTREQLLDTCEALIAIAISSTLQKGKLDLNIKSLNEEFGSNFTEQNVLNQRVTKTFVIEIDSVTYRPLIKINNSKQIIIIYGKDKMLVVPIIKNETLMNRAVLLTNNC